MKKILIGLGSIALALAIFAGGAYAANQGWLNFTGDDDIEQSQTNVDEIMEILRNVNDGKITAEDAVVKLEARVQELEDMNPSGLAKQNKELRERVAQLEDDIAAKNQEIEDKNTAYDQLQQERDQIAIARDNAIAERDTLQAKYNSLNDRYTAVQEELTQANEYVTHLESELTKANEAVANHAQSTNEALEEARGYGGDNSEQ